MRMTPLVSVFLLQGELDISMQSIEEVEPFFHIVRNIEDFVYIPFQKSCHQIGRNFVSRLAMNIFLMVGKRGLFIGASFNSPLKVKKIFSIQILTSQEEKNI